MQLFILSQLSQKVSGYNVNCSMEKGFEHPYLPSCRFFLKSLRASKLSLIL